MALRISTSKTVVASALEATLAPGKAEVKAEDGFDRVSRTAVRAPERFAAEVRVQSRAAVDVARAEVVHLKQTIADTEKANGAKRAEVDRLVRSIGDRKRDIEDERDRKYRTGMVFALFGVPAGVAVSLHQMMQDDGRLRQLEGDKREAEATRDRLELRATGHRQLVAKLQPKLDALEKVAAKLEAGLEQAPRAVAPRHRPVADSAARMRTQEKLLFNLRKQVALLGSMRDSAQGLSSNLDGAIEQLDQKVAEAEKLVEASRKDFERLMKIATAKDPNAAAQDYLRKLVADRTRKLMEQLGLSMNRYIDRLVKDAFPNGGPAAAELRRQLKKSLGGGPAPAHKD